MGMGKIEKLSKSEVMQLYHAAAVPAMSDLTGEFQAKTCPPVLWHRQPNFIPVTFLGRDGGWEKDSPPGTPCPASERPIQIHLSSSGHLLPERDRVNESRP
jgi:hypothetical protein